MAELDPSFRALLDAVAKLDIPPVQTQTPAEARERYARMRLGAPDPGPQDVAVRNLTVAGAAEPIGARLYTPSGAPERGPGVVFFHGGGWVLGDLESHDPFCRRLARASGMRVLSVDYRLAPEHPFPAPHDDAVAATDWAFEHAGEIGFDPARIAVAGDSAGGNLAGAVAAVLRDAGRHSLAFQALLYPVVETTCETGSYQRLADGYFLTRDGMRWFLDRLFAGGGDRDDPRVRLSARGDLSGLAPAFVSVAGYDPLQDEGRAYADALRAAGVAVELREYPAFIHGFYNMSALVPAVDAAIEDLAAALKGALSRAS